MTFRVGQKVACIKGFSPLSRPDARGVRALFKGRIYTVRKVVVDEVDGEFLHLSEISNPLHFSGVEYGYDTARFRPVQEQGMSILRAIAANTKQKIKENA